MYLQQNIGIYNLVQLLDYFGTDQKLRHVIKGIVRMPPRHWQASITPPVSDTHLGKEMLPNVQSVPPLALLWIAPVYPLTGSHGAGVALPSPLPLLYSYKCTYCVSIRQNYVEIDQVGVLLCFAGTQFLCKLVQYYIFYWE